MSDFRKEYSLDILGEKWTLVICPASEDKYLYDMDGYSDKTIRKMVVVGEPRGIGNEISDFEVHMKATIRHEIIHAFLYESGLHECWDHKIGHDETYVDWVAVQFPKLLKVFQEADAI